MRRDPAWGRWSRRRTDYTFGSRWQGFPEAAACATSARRRPTLRYCPPVPRSSSTCVSSTAALPPYNSGYLNRCRSSARLPPRRRVSPAPPPPSAAAPCPPPLEPPAPPRRPDSTRTRSPQLGGRSTSGTRPDAAACSTNSRLRLDTRRTPTTPPFPPPTVGDRGDTGDSGGAGNTDASTPSARAAATHDGVRRWPGGPPPPPDGVRRWPGAPLPDGVRRWPGAPPTVDGLRVCAGTPPAATTDGVRRCPGRHAVDDVRRCPGAGERLRGRPSAADRSVETATRAVAGLEARGPRLPMCRRGRSGRRPTLPSPEPPPVASPPNVAAGPLVPFESARNAPPPTSSAEAPRPTKRDGTGRGSFGRFARRALPEGPGAGANPAPHSLSLRPGRRGGWRGWRPRRLSGHGAGGAAGGHVAGGPPNGNRAAAVEKIRAPLPLDPVCGLTRPSAVWGDGPAGPLTTGRDAAMES